MVPLALGNDFESVVFSDFPQLKKNQQLLIESGARGAGLSGAGLHYLEFLVPKELFRARSAMKVEDIRLLETRTVNRVEFLEGFLRAYR
jgi:4-diphosphocytidyl-2C-methyl-D-erythritol kinase